MLSTCDRNTSTNRSIFICYLGWILEDLMLYEMRKMCWGWSCHAMVFICFWYQRDGHEIYFGYSHLAFHIPSWDWFGNNTEIPYRNIFVCNVDEGTGKAWLIRWRRDLDLYRVFIDIMMSWKAYMCLFVVECGWNLCVHTLWMQLWQDLLLPVREISRSLTRGESSQSAFDLRSRSINVCFILIRNIKGTSP